MSGIDAVRDYVRQHTERGACRCGKCDAPSDPESHQPDNPHTVSVFFFDVAKRGEPAAEELRELVANAHDGSFNTVDPLDGAEHGYMELGGWIGDQGLAMQFMALCELVGLGKVMQPGLLPIPEPMQQQMAGAGMVSLVAKAEEGGSS